MKTFFKRGVELSSSGGKHRLWPVETNHKKFLFGDAAVLIKEFWMCCFESGSVFCGERTTHQSDSLGNHKGKESCVSERIDNWEHWNPDAWRKISEARRSTLAAMFSGQSCK